MVQHRGLEGVWAALGHLLGGSWLQGTCGPLPGCLLGSSCAVLEVPEEHRRISVNIELHGKNSTENRVELKHTLYMHYKGIDTF